MTRKRFIKLCISLGYQRNTANAFAKCCLTANSSYSEYFKLVKRLKAIEDAGVSIESFTNSLRNMVNLIVEKVTPVFKRFADCMKEVNTEQRSDDD